MLPSGRRAETIAGVAGPHRRRVAGVSLALAGILATVGITLAGALYPDYSVHAQTISALGATDATGTLVQPAATVFTLSMGLSGLLVVVSGAVARAEHGRWLAGGLTATGLGILGVAAFPAHVGAMHFVAALVAFAGGGLTALIAAWETSGPIRWLSALLGATTLLALVTFAIFGGSTPLGVGGLERLVSLPIQCWAILYGGWLLGSDDARRWSGS
ncbi:MAG: DUF998 domain-containing protein [archaeon]